MSAETNQSGTTINLWEEYVLFETVVKNRNIVSSCIRHVPEEEARAFVLKCERQTFDEKEVKSIDDPDFGANFYERIVRLTDGSIMKSLMCLTANYDEIMKRRDDLT